MPRPETTLAVILGASEFPKAKDTLEPSPSFKRSAEAFRDYLLSQDGLGLDKNNVLDLFDTAVPSSDIDEQLRDFLRDRISTKSNGEKCVQDLIVYYVGHGGFTQSGTDYYLALRGTRLDNPLQTGYPVRSLATTLKTYAQKVRRFVIFDSCFSASAYAAFQASGPVQVALQQTLDVLPPEKGTALLCASGPRNPAKAPPDARYTMFSGALLDVLHEGDAAEPEYLTFQSLSEAVQQRIRAEYEDEAVRPEVHFPDQPQGSIGKLPLFPNAVKRKSAVEKRLDELELLATTLSKQLLDCHDSAEANSKALAETNRRVDALDKHINSGVAKRVEPNRPANLSSWSLLIDEHCGISESAWNNLPLEAKSLVSGWRAARRNGVNWLVFCGALLVTSVLESVSGLFSQNVMLFVVLGTVLAGLINWVSLILEFLRFMTPRSVTSSGNEEPAYWEHFDAVIVARRTRLIPLLPGYALTSPASILSAGILIAVWLINFQEFQRLLFASRAVSSVQ